VSVIDVATRKAWKELLTSTISKAVAVAFEKVCDRAYEALPDEDKKLKVKNSQSGQSKMGASLQGTSPSSPRDCT
jgi:hypothetical protein